MSSTKFRRRSNKKQVTAAIYGACHAEALRASLVRDPRFVDTVTFLPLKACFEMSVRDITRFERKIAPKIDVFIYQPVSGARMGERFAAASVLEHLRPDCLTLSFQYMHFELYNPFVNYPSRELPVAPFDYLDYSIVESFLSGRSRQEAVEAGERISIADHSVQEIQTWSLEQLKDREVGDTGPVDVAVTDFVREHHLMRCLFHTVNHPTGDVFAYLADRIALRLQDAGISCTSDRGLHGNAFDPLSQIHFPSLPAVRQATGMTFDDEHFRFNNKTHSNLDIVDRTYAYLERADRSLIYESIEHLAEKRPWLAPFATR